MHSLCGGRGTGFAAGSVDIGICNTNSSLSLYSRYKDSHKVQSCKFMAVAGSPGMNAYQSLCNTNSKPASDNHIGPRQLDLVCLSKRNIYTEVATYRRLCK